MKAHNRRHRSHMGEGHSTHWPNLTTKQVDHPPKRVWRHTTIISASEAEARWQQWLRVSQGYMENTISKTKKQPQWLTSVILTFRSQGEKEAGGKLGLYTKLSGLNTQILSLKSAQIFIVKQRDRWIKLLLHKSKNAWSRCNKIRKVKEKPKPNSNQTSYITENRSTWQALAHLSPWLQLHFL